MHHHAISYTKSWNDQFDPTPVNSTNRLQTLTNEIIYACIRIQIFINRLLSVARHTFVS